MKKKVATLLLVAAVASAAFAQDDATNLLRYESQKVDPWGPFALNLLLPFGIGSFVQGDNSGGLVVLGGQVAGGAMMAADILNTANYARVTVYGPLLYRPTFLFWGGLLVTSGATIAGYVFPFVYANEVNAKLRKNLGLSFGPDGISLEVEL